MTDFEMSYGAVEASALTEQLEKSHRELRTLCELEGLFPTYEEAHAYFFGEESFQNFSINDWLRDAENRFEVLNGTLAFYLISQTMAYIRCCKDALKQGKIKLAYRMVKKLDPTIEELRDSLPQIYLDILVKEENHARRGGYLKDISRKCRSMLGCLADNHRLDGVDFKSFDEAVAYAIEMTIDIENIVNKNTVADFRRFYPYVFKQWLAHEDAHSRFKEYTGISFDE